jgi:hypothetical protein
MSRKNNNRQKQITPAEQEVQEIIASPSSPKSSAQAEGRETLLQSYDQIKGDLKELKDRIHHDLADLVKREGEITKRELAVTECEQKTESGYTDKFKSLTDEAVRQHKANQEEAERLRKLADAIAAERKALEDDKSVIVQREKGIVTAEQTRDAGFADERAALHIELRNNRAKMETEVADVREQRLSELEDEMAKLKSKRLEEITKTEQTERERIYAEIAKEREAFTHQQEDARKQFESERTELERQKGAVSALQSKLEGRKVELEENERTIEVKMQRLEHQWQKRNDELDDEIGDQVEQERRSLAAQKKSFEDEIARLRDSICIQTGLVGAFEQLKRQLGDEDPAVILRNINSKTDELKRLQERLASAPTEEMRAKYNEMDSESQRQKARIEELVRESNANATTVAAAEGQRLKNSILEAENRSLAQIRTRFEDQAKAAEADLKRLRSAYERPVEVAARYKEIEMPHIKANKVEQPNVAEIDEVTWLDGIGQKCANYGISFNKRILYAFHTALKTAEWSPLTVLAGVSGTGKSELPRLYSHFGGLLFEPLSVQPNWDSQESMLGFFNSIDNKFDAQPVLRFLAQSQQSGNETYDKRIARWQEMSGNNIQLDPESEEDYKLIQSLQESDYPGLENSVCLVLLDEMNLAHPELYFAEFLSKLELRRGMKGADVPFLPVKIGAGMPPYKLPLGRNVLWTGTMNQDETTKSLSDKVLDRSIIIHFPRPTELKRRLKLEPLDEKNRGPSLHKSSWQKWLAQGSSFSEEDIKPFKSFIEEINAALAVSGRAIGHRVWQSIEYYMANYPDVMDAQKGFLDELKKARRTEEHHKKDSTSKPVEHYIEKYADVRMAHEQIDKDKLAGALHDAFEDQLVQKVMPKLRGIDTRGKGQTDCLDKVSAQISNGIGDKPFNLSEDFNLACELGYGQFIWQSANYLNKSKSYAPCVSAPDDNIQIAGNPDPTPSELPDDSNVAKNLPQLTLREDVLYAIRSMSSGMALDVPGGKIDNGLKIQQWDFQQNNDNQHWKLKKFGNYFGIISSKTGKCLDVQGASKEDKAFVLQWTAVFDNEPSQRLWKITAAPGGFFTIFAKHSGKYLSAPDPQYDEQTGNGAPITQCAFHGGENQKWHFAEIVPS